MGYPSVDEQLKTALFDKYTALAMLDEPIPIQNIRWLISAMSLNVLIASLTRRSDTKLTGIFGIPFIPIDAEPGYIQLIDIVNNEIIKLV